MTDENDRMDRARRIREIREGTADAQADDLTADSPAEASQETGETAAASEPGSATEDAGEPDRDTAAESAAGAGDPGAGSTATGPGDGAGTAAVTEEAGDSTEPGVDGSTAETEAAEDEGGLQIPAAETADVDVDVEELAEQAGLDTDTAEGADDEAVAGQVGMAGAESVRSSTATAETRVLEFDLGSERYCLDIDHVEEIVKRETVTRVPNTPEYVEGVVDLRGQITTILDPKVLLDIDGEGAKDLIVVFDPGEFEDQGAIGWVVDDVNQVTPVVDDEVNESPVDADHVNGVVERDGEFVVWTDPEVAIETAAG